MARKCIVHTEFTAMEKEAAKMWRPAPLRFWEEPSAFTTSASVNCTAV